MKKYSCIFFFLLLFCSFIVNAQKENSTIRKGNRYYKEQKFDESQKQYQQALQQSPDNPAANYNLGNAQFRKNSFEDAVKSYDGTIANTADKEVKEKTFYNKGVALMKQNKLDESIAAWKEALKLNPADEAASDNLQKALREKKNKQQQQNNKKQDDKKQDNKDQQKQDQKQQQQPQQQQSRLSKQKVEQYLKALEQKEKDVQDKMNQNKMKTLTQPDKDW